MTVRNGPLFLSLLLGIAGLVVWFCLDGEDGDRKACSSVSAAILASNPNLERSLQIEEAKKRCIRDRICDREVWILSGPREFGAYELGECRDLDPALAEFKIAQRHLEGGCGRAN